jgi:hypothetical protein
MQAKKRSRPLLAPPPPFFAISGDTSDNNDGDDSHNNQESLLPIVSANYKSDGLLLADYDLAVCCQNQSSN